MVTRDYILPVNEKQVSGTYSSHPILGCQLLLHGQVRQKWSWCQSSFCTCPDTSSIYRHCLSTPTGAVTLNFLWLRRLPNINDFFAQTNAHDVYSSCNLTGQSLFKAHGAKHIKTCAICPLLLFTKKYQCLTSHQDPTQLMAVFTDDVGWSCCFLRK